MKFAQMEKRKKFKGIVLEGRKPGLIYRSPEDEKIDCRLTKNA
jgi:hypothetical protein